MTKTSKDAKRAKRVIGAASRFPRFISAWKRDDAKDND
jgi:hypothetical protein